MTIDVRVVSTDADNKLFYEAQQAALGELPQWRPPPVSWERRLFEPGENPLLQKIAVERFIALEDGEVVGRIAAWVDQRRPDLGFFGFYDATTAAVGAALTESAKDFCRKQSRARIRGPVDFWGIVSAGVPSSGHELPNTFTLHHGGPQYAEGLEKAGLTRVVKIYMWRFAVREPEGAVAGLANATLANDALTTVPFDPDDRQHWKIVRELYTECYEDNDWFMPIELGELRVIGEDYIEPSVSFLMFARGTPAAMSLGLRNVVESSVRMGDVIPPESIQRVLRTGRRPNHFRQWLFCVAPQFRGRTMGHLGTAAYKLTMDGAAESKLTHGEAAWTQSQDKRLNATFALLGGRRDKVYYVYEGALD